MKYTNIFSNFKSLYKQVFRWLMKPITQYKVSFCFYAFLIFLPELCTVPIFEQGFYFKEHFFDTFLLALGISYVLCLLTLIVCKIPYCEKCLMFLFHFVVYIVPFIDIFLYRSFWYRINATALTMLAETNTNETSEFLSTYCTNSIFFGLLLLFVFIGLAEYCIHRIITHRNNFLRSAYRWGTPPIFLILIIYRFFSYQPFFASSASDNYKLAYNKPINNTLLWNINQAILLFNESQNDNNHCIESQKDLRIDSCSHLSANVVCLIGESFNRHHSNLYGYKLNTNPKLSSLSNLYTFTDVISSDNGTHLSFRNFLSLSSVDDNIIWSQAPFFWHYIRHVATM